MALFNEPPTQQLAAHPVCVWHSLRAASHCQEKKKSCNLLVSFLSGRGGTDHNVSITERQSLMLASSTICYQNYKSFPEPSSESWNAPGSLPLNGGWVPYVPFYSMWCFLMINKVSNIMPDF